MTEKAELERIVDASPAVLYRCEWRGVDDDFAITYISASVTTMFAYERRACLEPGWWFSHVHPDDLRAVAGHIRNLRKNGEIEHVYRFAAKSGDYRWVRHHACMNLGEDGEPDEFIGSWLDITESRQRDQQVYESEEIYRSLVEQAFDGIAIIGADGRIVFSNEVSAAAWGAKPEDVIGKRSIDIVHPDERKTISLYFRQCMDGNEAKKPYETRLIRKNGETAWVEVSERLITWHGQPADLLTLHDITDRKFAEQSLGRINRSLATLSRCDDVLIHATNEARFLSDICQAIVSAGGFRLAWIGRGERDEEKRVTPVAEAGFDAGYLDNLNITWKENEHGYGPTGTAIRTGEPAIVRNIHQDARFAPWRAAALKHGYQSSIALPLLVGSEVYGALNIYACEPDGFNASEIRLLIKLVGNVGYGISVLRARDKHLRAEAGLKKSEHQLREAQRITRLGFIEANLETDELYMSDEAYRMYGIKKGEIGTMSELVNYVHPDDMELVQNRLAMAIRDERPYELEHRLIRPDGSIIWTQSQAELIRDGNGKPAKLVGTSLDITERKASEVLLRASEQKYRTLFESSTDAILMLDETSILACNEATLRMFSCHSKDDLVGKHPSELSPEKQPGCQDSLRLAAEHIATAFRAGSHNFEWMHKRLDGSEFPTDILLTVVNLGDGPVLQATVRDITVRKQKEALLARRERQLAVLAKAGKTINETLDEQKIGRKLVDFARKLVDCESGAVGFYRQGQIIFTEYSKGKQHHHICYKFPPGYGVPGHVMQTGKPYVSHDALHDEHVIAEIQQQLGFLRLIDVPIVDADGAFLGCFEMHDRLDGQDFDDQDMEMLQSLSGIVASALVNAGLLELQRRNHQELKQAAKRMRTVLDADFDAVIVHQDFKVVFANAAALKMFSFTQEQQALGADVIGFVDKKYQRLAVAATNRVLRTNKPVGLMESLAFDAKRNKSFPIEIASAPILWLGDKAVVSIVRDISQRKQAEAEMRLLESAVGSVNESIIITDADGTIVYVNASFTSNTGFEPEYAIGKTPAILNSKQQSKGFYDQFWHTLKRGEPWAGRILDRKKDGTIFPVHLSVAPIFDDRGDITHFVAVHEDLTQAEAMQKKMMQAQKMEAVGTMVGGLAHDFNNMLASIVGNFYLIRRQHPDDEKLLSRIRAMEASTLHGANMIRQMLTFSRKDHPEMHAMQLSSFIKEAHKLAEAAMPENIYLALRISDSEGVCIKADATQLQQVLLNLITNAQHAVEDAMGNEGRGKITIEIDCQPPPDRLLQENPEMISDSDWCCIRCVDNGSGIKSDDLEHVFEPFFTTKGVGKGTGLGMAMVYGAVQNHRGLIDIDSTPGEGTTISIWLPQQREKGADVVGEEEVVFDGGGRTVLLVDDEDGLRKVLAEVLEHNGFAVLQACDGEQAVQLFRAQCDQIAIVLMDVVMPNKGGVMAAQEIRQMDAHVPIIFQTGYGEQTQLDAADSITHSAALQKPVLISEMLRTMMAHLQG